MTKPQGKFGDTSSRRLGAIDDEDELRKAFRLWEELPAADRAPFAFYEVLWAGYVRGIRLRADAPKAPVLCRQCDGQGFEETPHDCGCSKCEADDDFKACPRCYGEGLRR